MPDLDLVVHDRHLNLNSRFDGDARDLLHQIRRRVQINQPLVNSHGVSIPRVRTFPARSFTNRHLQLLRRHANRAFDLQSLFLGASNQIRAHFLQVLHVSGGEGDADSVDALRFGIAGFRRGGFSFDCC